jgi:hypothetical protein
LSNFYFKYSPTFSSSSLWLVTINDNNSYEILSHQNLLESNRVCHQNRDQIKAEPKSEQSNVKKCICLKSVENVLQKINTANTATIAIDAQTLSSRKESNLLKKQFILDKIKTKLRTNSKKIDKSEISTKSREIPNNSLERYQVDPRFTKFKKSEFDSHSSSLDSSFSSKQSKLKTFLRFQWPPKCSYLSKISKVKSSNSNLKKIKTVYCSTSIDNSLKNKKSISQIKSNVLHALLNKFKNKNKIKKEFRESKKENAFKAVKKDSIEEENKFSTKIFYKNQSDCRLIRKRFSKETPNFFDSFIDTPNLTLVHKEKEDAMVNLNEINRSNSINFSTSSSSSSMKISALAAAILTPKFLQKSKEKVSTTKFTSSHEDTFENRTNFFPSLPPTHKPPPPMHDSNRNLSFCCSHEKLENNSLMANKFRSSNEYSEPFDLLTQNQEYKKISKYFSNCIF